MENLENVKESREMGPILLSTVDTREKNNCIGTLLL